MARAQRKLSVWDAGEETAGQGFARDHLMMALAARDGVALARLWRRSEEGLSLGRFHRRRPGDARLARRLSGGRVVAVGPGIQCLNLVFPSVDWLEAASAGLRPLQPSQVLNRALRPLLSLLRACGADVIYPGRDLVTLGGCPLAHAAFTVAPDGVCLVEAQLGVEVSLSRTPALLAEYDPQGVAGVDTGSLANAVALSASLRRSPRRGAWGELLSGHFGAEFDCSVRVAGAELDHSAGAAGVEFDHSAGAAGVEALAASSPAPSTPSDPAGREQAPGRPAHNRGDAPVVGTAGVFRPCPEAFSSFQESLGPLPPGRVLSAAPGMLGLIECSADLREGRIHDLRVSGDFIAPFHTIEALRQGCEGLLYDMPTVRRVLARVMIGRRNFVLGAPDLDGLIASMA